MLIQMFIIKNTKNEGLWGIDRKLSLWLYYKHQNKIGMKREFSRLQL